LKGRQAQGPPKYATGRRKAHCSPNLRYKYSKACTTFDRRLVDGPISWTMLHVSRQWAVDNVKQRSSLLLQAKKTAAAVVGDRAITLIGY